jgi:hypothetical protein
MLCVAYGEATIQTPQNQIWVLMMWANTKDIPQYTGVVNGFNLTSAHHPIINITTYQYIDNIKISEN